MLRLTTTFGALLLLVAPLHAADLVVPGDFASIQDAVDAAATGDRVIVKSGVYFENPTVTTDGLVLEGRGASLDGQYRGPCLTVAADGVTVSGFTLLNGGDADGASATLSWTGDDGRIEGNTLVGGAGAGLDLTGLDPVVRGNTIVGCAGVAVSCVATDDESRTTIDANRIEACGAGIYAEDGRTDLRGNSVQGVRGTGIELLPDIFLSVTTVEARVENNTLTQIDGPAIDVTAFSGGTVTVRRNRLDQVRGVGIQVTATGDSGVAVTRNRVRGVSETGAVVSVQTGTFFVAWNQLAGIGATGLDATAGSDGGKLEKNVLRDVSGDGLSTSGDGVIVRQNRLRDVSGHGIDVAGDTCSMTLNRVRDAGLCGIRLVGDDCTLSKNVVSGSALDGLRTSGSDNTLVANVSSANGGDGIDLEELDLVIDDSSNVVRDNVCVGNAHEGIDNTALNTVIDDNRVARNGGELGPEIAGAGNDVDGDGNPDGTVASFQGNKVPAASGDKDPGGPSTAQRLDLGVPAPE